MDDSLTSPKSLRAEQDAIRAKCCHPSGTFIEFKKEEIEQSIPERFEKMVRMHPDRTAIKTRTHLLTYDELNRNANRVSRAILDRCEKRKENPVVLLLENDAPMIAAILGVLKTGNIYTPLDPQYPETKARCVVEDSQAPFILTNSRNLPKAIALAQQIQQVINIDEIDATFPTDNIGMSISPDALAYILYTSGSTGEPRGVVQNHRNIQYKTMTYTNDLHFCADDRISLLSPCTFALSVGFIFGALLNGASLYIKDVKDEGLSCLANWLIQNRISVYNSVPSVFRGFIDALTQEVQFPDLRLVHLGGEQVTKRDVELYKRHFSPDCIFLNNLGSAETGTIAQYFIDKATLIDGSVVPSGYATPDTEILVLDDNNNKIAPNQVGTIALKSRYLALGYWRKTDPVPSTLLRPPGIQEDRIYRTGDLGLMRPDGCLEHVGRKDFQVKINGQRVELGEIEVALLDLETVKQAVVVATENQFDGHSGTPSRDKRLVAYIVPAKESPPATTSLRSALMQKLPGYMVPSKFVFLDALPLTPRGKVDRRALPPPETSRPKLDNLFVPPRHRLERKLAKVWEQILEIHPIGVRDSFFDLGGDSLLAVSLLMQIEKTFGTSLPLASLHQAPTIEQLADMIQKERRSAPGSLLVPIQPAGFKPPFFWVYGYASDLFLPRYLGPDQPLYGLKNQTQNGTRAVYNRLEDIAAHHLKELRTVQPEGPYFLGGFCFGGIVAFEMAQQLCQQGQKVALLVLADLGILQSCNFGMDRRWSFKNLLVKLAFFRDKLARHSRNLGSSEAHEKVSYVSARANVTLKHWGRDLISGAKDIARVVSRTAHLAIGHPLPPSLRESYIRVADRRALRGYKPQMYPGRLILFQVQASAHGAQWIGRFAAGGFEVHEVPGNHGDIIKESHIGLWADTLRSHLAEAQAKEMSEGNGGMVYEPRICISGTSSAIL